MLTVATAMQVWIHIRSEPRNRQPSAHPQWPSAMAAQRRRPRLLALTALVVLLLAQQAACSTLNTDQAGSDAGGKEADGGKKGGKDAAAAPAPQPARKKQPKAAAAPAPAPAAQDNSPSPSPSPEAAASPLPAQAYCAPGSGCVLFRLIMKVEGAPNPMSQLDASVSAAQRAGYLGGGSRQRVACWCVPCKFGLAAADAAAHTCLLQKGHVTAPAASPCIDSARCPAHHATPVLPPC